MLLGLARNLHKPLLLLVLVLHLPLMWFKALRWQHLLQAQRIQYGLRNAYLAYFGSMFIGLLTPGRLGEFVKAVHVTQDCGMPLTYAMSSVFSDRLFDLYLLLIVGGAAMLDLAPGGIAMPALLGSSMLVTIPVILFLDDSLFGYVQRATWLDRWRTTKIGWIGARVSEMRTGMRALSWRGMLWASILTILAYGVFFGQCYLLAQALQISASFAEVSFAVAIGSLITLVPISISGLGTREAVMIAYLGTLGISAEQALGFSLLVFLTFYLGGGLLGAIAWWIKPASIEGLKVG